MINTKLKVARLVLHKSTGVFKIHLVDDNESYHIFTIERIKAADIIQRYSLQAVESEFSTEYVST